MLELFKKLKRLKNYVTPDLQEFRSCSMNPGVNKNKDFM